MTYYMARYKGGRLPVRHASRDCVRLAHADAVVAVRDNRTQNIRKCRYCCPDEWAKAEKESREYAVGLFEVLKGGRT